MHRKMTPQGITHLIGADADAAQPRIRHRFQHAAPQVERCRRDLDRIIERSQGDKAIARGWQIANWRSLVRTRVAPLAKTVGHVEQRFAMVALGPSRIRPAIGQAKIHRPQAGGSQIVQPGDLHRRRLPGKDQYPAPAGVSGNVDQNIDPVGADHRRYLGVRQSGQHPAGYSGKGIGRKSCLGCVIKIGEHFKLLAIMLQQDRLQEEACRRMTIGRDIADAQFSGRCE